MIATPASPALCDLHCHSSASDGSDDPADLPRLARQAGLSTLALTDHDTVDGLAAASAAADAIGLRFIPGIELSVNPDLDGTAGADHPPRGTLHLLGYGVDAGNPALLELCAFLRETRAQRNPAILARLADLGVRIDIDEVDAAAGGGVVGRPHIAQVLVRRGYVRSVHEAFHRYLGRGGAAHVRRDALDARRAIDTLHGAGARVALAHPVQLRLAPEALEHAVARLVDLGLDGIEVLHPDHAPADVEHAASLARRFGLLTTGGSDYHGSRKATPLGACRVPDACADALVDALAGA